jgi:hypothetical protein
MVTIVLLWVPLKMFRLFPATGSKRQGKISDGSARASYSLSIRRFGIYHDAIVIDRYKK